jgi:hypothetical protein
LVPVPTDGFCEETLRLVPDDLPARTLDAVRRAVDPTPDFPAIAAPCDDLGRCFEYVVCGVIDYDSVSAPWPVGATPLGAEKVVMTSGDRNRLLVADVSGAVESIEFEGFSFVGLIGVAGSEVWVAVARSDEYYVGKWEVDGGGEVILEPFPGDFRTLWGFVGADREYFWTVEDPGSRQPRICGLRPDGTSRTVAVLDDDIFYNHLWRRRWLPRQVGSWVYIDAEHRICVDEVDEGFAVREEVIFPVGDAPYSGLEPPEYPIYHVTDGQHVYFTSNIEQCEGYDECSNPPTFRDGIWRAPVKGGEAEPLFPDLPDVADSALSLHGGWLYWALEEDQSVYRTHTETLETQEVFRPTPTPTDRWEETFFVHAGYLWRVDHTQGGTDTGCLVRLDLTSLCLPPATHETTGAE